MARLAACLALSAVVVLAIGIGPGSAQVDTCFGVAPVVFDTFTDGASFIRGLNLKPMRIVSKDNPSLSMAVDANGDGVVLVKTSCGDPNQAWFKHFVIWDDVGEFVLVNLDAEGMPRAMRISGAVGDFPVKVETYKPCLAVPKSMLWTQDDPLLNNQGYYKIRSFKDTNLILDGLGGNVVVGTVVGAFPENTATTAEHVLWKIQDFA